MSLLPQISGRKAITVFEKIGYRVSRQRGSHIRLDPPVGRKPITIPDHKILAKGLLRKIIRDSGVSVKDFLELLNG